MSGRARLLYFVRLHRCGLAVTLFAAGLLLTPLLLTNPYHLGLTNQVALFALVVLGLNLFVGFAGQISLGHAAFFGLGAYGSAIATVRYGLPAWPALLLVAALVALVALLLGLVVLRLEGHYLAMATLGFNLVLHSVLLEWDSLTGGPSGFYGIAPLQLGSFVFDSEARLHYLLWSLCLLALLLSLNLVRSGVGRGLAALAGDPVAAAALGVAVGPAKIRVFVLSAVYAAVGGSLFAHSYGFISPDSFDIFASTDLVIMVVIGGMGSLWGSLLGAAFISLLPEWIDLFETWKDFVHGGLLVLILLFLPQGLVRGLSETLRRRTALKQRQQVSGHAAS
ncbi:MAG: branched-chain amino acid ABC transporter permease [Desulfuromonas thiophila]|jgi:branched-chain amino acid transport system permease protein|nr:branched-chain amino acid ABC transporter permease [Desulfuromonas thiophila]